MINNRQILEKYLKWVSQFIIEMASKRAAKIQSFTMDLNSYRIYLYM